MLGLRSILVPALVAHAASVLACAEPEPSFAPPSAIVGRQLPGVKLEGATSADGGGGPFGGPYDADAGVPTTTMKKAHAAKNAPLDPTACLGCHTNKTGTAGAPAFAFGGRVLLGNGGPDPAANADVVVMSGDGARLGPVKSDADGYFWLKSDVDVVDGRTTVRSAKGELEMNGKLFAGHGGCGRASCHGQSLGPPEVYVPK